MMCVSVRVQDEDDQGREFGREGEESATEQTHHIIIPSYSSWFDYNWYIFPMAPFVHYIDLLIIHLLYVCVCVHHFSPFLLISKFSCSMAPCVCMCVLA